MSGGVGYHGPNGDCYHAMVRSQDLFVLFLFL